VLTFSVTPVMTQPIKVTDLDNLLYKWKAFESNAVYMFLEM